MQVVRDHLVSIQACLMVVLSLAVPVSASASDSFTITSAMIRSQESCPVPGAVQLRCSTYHQTTNYTCGPASVMTVMRFYGKMSSGEMNKTTEMRISAEMGATPGAGGGTSSGQLSSWLRSHGLSVSSGSNISTDMLINNINRHVLTIVSYNNHWIVAKGYRKASASTYQNNDEILFADSCCGTSVLPRSMIDSTWQESHMSRRQCSVNGEYLVVSP